METQTTPDLRAAEAKALEVLAANFVTSFPFDVRSIVAKYSLRVSEVALDTDKVGDVIAGILPEEKILVVNQTDPEPVKNFALAYELGLWLLHREFLTSTPWEGLLNRVPLGELITDPRKKEAVHFAAHLLIPNPNTRVQNISAETSAASLCVPSDLIGYRTASSR